MSSAPSSSSPSAFPAGIHNAYWFAAFNALSFPIMQSSPMVLYAKSLGASATILGIVAGMMPLLVIAQIPAAGFIDRVGYKRFVYAGWGMRVMFIFGIALVPLTGSFLDTNNRLALTIALLFCFNLSRGISSSAWLPWITELVPAESRGRYLVRDAATVNFGCFVTFLIAAALLHGETHGWKFSVIFAFSAIAGGISLVFLKRIPDAPIPESVRSSRMPVPWLEILRFLPFKRLLRSVVAWSVAYGGLTAFTVAYLRTEVGMSEGKILLVTSVAYLGGLSSFVFLGHRLDRLGSRPVLTFAFAVWLVVLAGWVALAGGVLNVTLTILLGLQFLMGLLASVVNMANNRLAMAIIPKMGRNHFFALYSVLSNVTLGLAPIGWGLLIDAIGDRQAFWVGLSWNRYTVFFGAACVAFAVSLVLSRTLDEPKAASLEELLKDLLIQSPQRLWLRFWPRP